jgi:hypothetical protein
MLPGVQLAYFDLPLHGLYNTRVRVAEEKRSLPKAVVYVLVAIYVEKSRAITTTIEQRDRVGSGSHVTAYAAG